MFCEYAPTVEDYNLKWDTPVSYTKLQVPLGVILQSIYNTIYFGNLFLTLLMCSTELSSIVIPRKWNHVRHRFVVHPRRHPYLNCIIKFVFFIFKDNLFVLSQSDILYGEIHL